MLRSFQFTDSILQGCIIKVKINEEDSLTSVIAQCVERVLIILENFNLNALTATVKNKQFRLDQTMQEIMRGEESDLFKIESHA